MVLISATKPEQEDKSFPWEKVTFKLSPYGDLDVDDDMRKAWLDYGFIIVKQLFSSETVKSLEKCTMDPNVQERLQPRVDEEGYKVNLVLWNNCDNGLFGACSRCEKVVNPMEDLLGGEVYHYHTKLVLKQPHGGGAFNWHQDYGYWYKNGCLSPDLATLWLPLDKVDSKNGCLKIIPGSHKLGRIDHININNQVTADPERVFHVLNKYGFTYVEMEPGDGLFFHSNVLHSSDQNWSEDRRWAVISSYNLQANDPVYKHHHPNYYYLEKIKNSEIVSFHGKFATDYKFMVDDEDKSLREGCGEEDHVK